jgi:hypothetical protein
METIFSLANLFVLPFWLLMIALPYWRWTRRLMEGLWPMVILAVIYAGLLISQVAAPGGRELVASLANPSAGAIAALLGQPAGATVGWVHFLAFDLFVGRWAYLDSRARGLSAWLASPALFFILMAGPLGFLLYLLARAAGMPQSR